MSSQQNDFLPAGYEQPDSGGGNYLRFEDGENKFRILSKPILGWLDWTADNKPVRSRYENKPATPIRADRPVKHFWAMKVFNYATHTMQVLEVTQVGIIKSLTALVQDLAWGSPMGYDIKVIKKGQKLDTEYQVMAQPPAPVVQEVKDAYLKTPINLDALFSGGDPFAAATQQQAPTQQTPAPQPKSAVPDYIPNSGGKLDGDLPF